MTLARGVSTVLGLVALVALVAGARPAEAQNTLRVVMHSDLKIVDPIWTTAYIVRNHGYMIYDTLFAMDAKGEIKPQMVDKYDVSADKLTYTMTLRDGLLWHDGKPVTAEDCVASIKRWAAKDSMGHKMISFVQDLQATGRPNRMQGVAAPGPLPGAQGGLQHSPARAELAGKPVHLPLQHAPQAVRQPQGPPGGDVGLQSGRLPQGRHRRQAILQGLSVAVPVRHASRVAQGLRWQFPRRAQRRQGAGAPAGGRIRWHDDRAHALDRPRRAEQPRARGQVAPGARGLP